MCSKRLQLSKTESPRFREFLITLRMIRRSKLTLVALGVIIMLYIVATIPFLIAPYDPYELHLENKLAPPSTDHLFGTDQMGRDILSRLIYGTQISMYLGIVVVAVTNVIGVPLGSVAGYAGGKIDEVIMRITDMFMAFPAIVLAMLLAYVLGRGAFSALVALSLVNWCSTARLIRGVVISEKEKEYVTAAKILGKNTPQILFEEILPNSIHPIIVTSTLNIGWCIVWMAALSFIGVGVQPPIADWGVMISTGHRFLLDQPWIAITPGLLIILAVLSFNIVGDTLRDALDPRLRRQIR